MNNNEVAIVSRIAYGLCLIVFAFFHFSKAPVMAGGVPSFIPGGIIWVYITGIALVLAGIAFIINKKVKLAAYLLGLMLIIFVLTIHLPGFLNAGDAEVRQGALINLLKDTAIAAFALHIGANATNTSFE